jgi:hypothetical protein
MMADLSLTRALRLIVRQHYKQWIEAFTLALASKKQPCRSLASKRKQNRSLGLRREGQTVLERQGIQACRVPYMGGYMTSL